MSKFCYPNDYLLNYKCSAVTTDWTDAMTLLILILYHCDRRPRALYSKSRCDRRVTELKLPTWAPPKQLADYSSSLEKIPVFLPQPLNPTGLLSLS